MDVDTAGIPNAIQEVSSSVINKMDDVGVPWTNGHGELLSV